MQVQFQVGVSPHTGELRAVCVMARREFIRGTIESVKDQVRRIPYSGKFFAGAFQPFRRKFHGFKYHACALVRPHPPLVHNKH